MSIELENALSSPIGPLQRLYLQVSSSSRGFNCRDLSRYMKITLGVASGERLQRHKVQGMALQLFSKLDSNRDGLICHLDIKAARPRLRKAMAPTSSQDLQTVSEAARRRFREISPRRKMEFQDLQGFLLKKLPVSLPFRKLISQTGALLALEVVSPEFGEDLRSRTISEDQWIDAALELSL